MEKGQKKKEVIRVLLDDVEKEDTTGNKIQNLDVYIVKTEKSILNIDVGKNKNSKCKPKTGENFELTENCHVIMPGSISNLSTTASSSASTWNINVINEVSTPEDVKMQRNSVELSFFGKKSAISKLIGELRKIYDDMVSWRMGRRLS